MRFVSQSKILTHAMTEKNGRVVAEGCCNISRTELLHPSCFFFPIYIRGSQTHCCCFGKVPNHINDHRCKGLHHELLLVTWRWHETWHWHAVLPLDFFSTCYAPCLLSKDGCLRGLFGHLDVALGPIRAGVNSAGAENLRDCGVGIRIFRTEKHVQSCFLLHDPKNQVLRVCILPALLKPTCYDGLLCWQQVGGTWPDVCLWNWHLLWSPQL
jgi:hypothetical protein